MEVTKEDKIFKSVALLSIFAGIFVRNSKLDDDYKLGFAFLTMVVLGVLGVRKFLRAKKEGKPLTPFYLALGFVILTVLFTLYMLYRIKE
ncbi:MAG: hypothetical protein PSV16_16010 [Flavobacterium sp.]|nr:hypothetical protein [Flavobacterium sp.]